MNPLIDYGKELMGGNNPLTRQNPIATLFGKKNTKTNPLAVDVASDTAIQATQNIPTIPMSSVPPVSGLMSYTPPKKTETPQVNVDTAHKFSIGSDLVKGIPGVGLDTSIDTSKPMELPKTGADLDSGDRKEVDLDSGDWKEVGTETTKSVGDQIKNDPIVGLPARAVGGAIGAIGGGLKGLWEGITQGGKKTIQDIKDTWNDPRKPIQEKLVEIPLGLVVGQFLGGDVVGSSIGGAIEGAYQGTTTQGDRATINNLKGKALEFVNSISGSDDPSFISEQYEKLSDLNKERVNDWVSYGLDALNLVGIESVAKNALGPKGFKGAIDDLLKGGVTQEGKIATKASRIKDATKIEMFEEPPKDIIQKGKERFTNLFADKDPLNNLNRVYKNPNGGNKLLRNTQYIDNKVELFPALKEEIKKGELGITRDGDFYPGALPETVNDNVDVLIQFMDKRGKQINEMVKRTDAKGITLDMDQVLIKTFDKIDELRDSKKITGNEAQIMKNTIMEYEGEGSITWEQGQNIIASLNKKLESQYGKAQHTAAQDGLLEFSATLRKELDNGIDALDDKTFGTIKRQYGAAKASLQEAMHYYNINNQKAPIGLWEGLGYLSDPVGGLKQIAGTAIKDANSRDTAVKNLWKVIMKEDDIKAVFPKAKGKGYQGTDLGGDGSNPLD